MSQKTLQKKTIVFLMVKSWWFVIFVMVFMIYLWFICDGITIFCYGSIFFSAGLPHCFYIMHLSHFKGCCWLRFVFITTKKYIILILLCILLFEVTKPWLICGYHGYKNHDFFIFLYVLKPWLTFVREHGNSERILDALLVVKLFKHIINLNTQKGFKGLWFYECSLPESDARASFSYIYIIFF